MNKYPYEPHDFAIANAKAEEDSKALKEAAKLYKKQEQQRRDSLGRFIKMCHGCRKYPATCGSLCEGCDAYMDHTGRYY